MTQIPEAPQRIIEERQRWASAVDTVATRIGQRFPRAEPRQRAPAYLPGLRSPIKRKNSWQ